MHLISARARRRALCRRIGLFLGVLAAAAAVALGCAAAPTPAPMPFTPAATEPAAAPAAVTQPGAAAGTPITRTFKVIDQGGAGVMGAGVYVDGVCVGVTDANGALEAPARAGAAVAALRRTGEQPTVRRNPADAQLPAGARPDCAGSAASCAGFGCAYQVFQTSLTWRAAGGTATKGAVEPEAALLPVADTAITLTIAATRPLILFNVLVSVGWDARPDYLADLAEGLRQASQYIWDYTDGQMALGQAAILNDRAGWTSADIQIQANNETCPQASIGGMMRPATTARPATTLGPYWTQGKGAAPSGRWSLPDGYRTIGHEFAHYALGLYDQYVDAQRQKGAWCTTQFPQPATALTNASIMDRQYTASELDDDPYNWAPACAQTWHYAIQGRSAWATLGQKSWAGARLTTPGSQGGSNPGPANWPSALPAWPDISIQSAPSEAAPINLRINGPGSYSVYVMQCSRGRTTSIELGRASGGQWFDVLGARPGDLIWVRDRGVTGLYGAMRTPLGASATQELTIRPCKRVRPVSCDDPFPDGICDSDVPVTPGPPVGDGGTNGTRRSLFEHGYQRNPERDAYPNTLESADGRFRLYLDAPPNGDIAIVEQSISDEIRQFLWSRELAPVGNLYLLVTGSQVGFSGHGQVQSICPPRVEPVPTSLWRMPLAAESDGELRLIQVEQASWFPQEGYVLAPIAAPAAYLLATRP